MWIVCDTCGKKVCDDKNLYRHRNDTPKSQCKKCIKCDVPITSRRQIRTHMKLNHRDFPCSHCNKKFYLAAARDQHWRDVHSGKESQEHPPEIPTAVFNTPSDQPKGYGGNGVYSFPDISDQDTDPDETSSDCSTPSELDGDSDTSIANEDCQQPEHNTRFLTNFQSCGNNLKRLLNEKVRQDPDTMRRYKATVHELVQFMQHNCGVSEVVKGGSLGKGTSIKEKADIDLIVFMRNITTVADLQEKHKDIIKGLKKHILKDFTFAKQVHYSYDTKHSNRFGIRIDDGKGLIQVDLLPACDIGGGSERVFDLMAGKDKEARSFYSVSFAKDQVKFTREKPEPVKDAIRLVKDWKMREKLNIPSYTAEIVTSKEWERMGRPDKPDLDQLFKRTMTQFSHMDNINITWPNDRAEYSRSSDQTRGPIVMDPTNPFNNTASMIGRSDQGVIEMKAREVVRWL